MRLTSPRFLDGDAIPSDYAFGVHRPETHVTFGPNRNPPLDWSGEPEGTRSFALTMVDHDAPSRADDVNREGRQVPADLPRVDFVHWLIVDLPAERHRIREGEFSDGVVPHGKVGRSSGPVEGLNDYTRWFARDPDMKGTYRGYDGPGPPWNDSLWHHYELALYALDVETLGLEGDFTIADAHAAMESHVLAVARLVVAYAINRRVAA
jgi:hypothetical protein